MKKLYLLTAIVITLLPVLQLPAQGAKPTTKKVNWEFLSAKKKLNSILEKHWKKANLSKVAIADDYTFIRRAYLDITGKIPSIQEINTFVANKNHNKRAILIKNLLASPNYADLTAQRYAHIFRIKSEFPINLWPNAVQLYFRYFQDVAAQDTSYDQMAYNLLTTNGSNFRIPESNFFRATPSKTPKDLAKITALTFLNINTNKLSDSQQAAFANFFSRIRYKSTDEWKEEIVYNDPQETTLECVEPLFGESFTINTAKEDPRVVFANFITKGKGKQQFAKAFANRVWHQLFGFGIINPVDDMPFTGEVSCFDKFCNFFSSEDKKEPSFEDELLDFLANYTIKTKFKRKELIKLITSCKAYNADWKTKANEMDTAKKLFAIYPLRRIGGEVIVDLLSSVTGIKDSYTSVIPEPFTFLPKNTFAIQIADGSITSKVLDDFGRSPRDSGLIKEDNRNITAAQRLYLMNSTTLYNRIQKSIPNSFYRRKYTNRQRIDELYLKILSRKPTNKERAKIEKFVKVNGRKNPWTSVIWALLNTQEFLYHH